MLLGAAARRSVVATLHPLFALGLHFVPLLLLRGVEECTDLRVTGLVDVHHFAAAILLRLRGVLAQALHLGMFGCKYALHFGLLVSREIQLFGQFLGALSGDRTCRDARDHPVRAEIAGRWTSYPGPPRTAR